MDQESDSRGKPEPKPKEQEARAFLRRIAVKVGSRTRFISINDVQCLSGSGNYVEVHHGTQRDLIRNALTQIETKLPPESFVRVSRTAIINVHHVVEMHSKGKRDTNLLLANGHTVKLTRNLKLFEERILFT